MAGLVIRRTDAPITGRSQPVQSAGSMSFSDGSEFRIPFELMRIYSPSAEVQGHGPGQEVLQTGKRNVDLAALERGWQLRGATHLLGRTRFRNFFLGLPLLSGFTTRQALG